MRRQARENIYGLEKANTEKRGKREMEEEPQGNRNMNVEERKRIARRRKQTRGGRDLEGKGERLGEGKKWWDEDEWTWAEGAEGTRWSGALERKSKGKIEWKGEGGGGKPLNMTFRE